MEPCGPVDWMTLINTAGGWMLLCVIVVLGLVAGGVNRYLIAKARLIEAHADQLQKLCDAIPRIVPMDPQKESR